MSYLSNLNAIDLYAYAAYSVMAVLFYRGLILGIEVRLKRSSFTKEQQQFETYLEISSQHYQSFPENGLIRSVLVNQLDLKLSEKEIDYRVQKQFISLAMKLSSLKEQATAYGMFFTVTSLILMGVGNDNSDVSSYMSLFTTAMITTAVGSFIAIISSKFLGDLKAFVLEASEMVNLAQMTLLRRKHGKEVRHA